VNALLPNSAERPNWRELYRAAILELDPSKLPQRIREAEMVFIARARELFQDGGGNGEETEDLDNAMYVLNALRNTVKHNRAVARSPNDMKVA